MKTLRFTPRVEKALRELAGLPWAVDKPSGFGVVRSEVRCEGFCPVSAAAAAEGKAGGDGWRWWEAAGRLGWSQSEGQEVADAADHRDDPLRPRLLKLLGVT